MSVNTDLAKPETSDNFEAMCYQLLRQGDSKEWMRMGRSGQGQGGVDILGNDGRRNVGIQCKHYILTKFTFRTVTDDISKVERSGLSIDHLIFQTTAPNDATVVRQVFELNAQRRASGKFTVTVEFWGDLCEQIRMHPEIGKAYIPSFPGGTLLDVRDNTTRAVEGIARIESAIENIAKSPSLTPAANGREADPTVVQVLDLVRDKIRQSKTTDADELLDKLGDPNGFRDTFSQFRWHTNKAAIDLANGRTERAAERMLRAFALAPDNETAHSNRIRALYLMDQLESAENASAEAIAAFPVSPTIWSLAALLNAKIGNDTPFASIPESVRSCPEVKLVEAELKHRAGEHEDALRLIRDVLETDNSIDVRRTYLAEALGWVVKNPVLAFHRNLSELQKAALQDAVSRFENIENYLTNLQSDYVAFEVTSNLCVALQMLDQDGRAQEIVKATLARHPDAENLLRLRIRYLAENKEFNSIKELIEGRLTTLTPSVLAILAEVFARDGDLEWYQKIRSLTDAQATKDPRLLELHVLEWVAYAAAGAAEKASSGLKNHVAQNPQHTLGQILLIELLEEQGDREAAVQQGRVAFTATAETATEADKIQLGETLFHLGLFNESAKLISATLKSYGADKLTWLLLVSLVETDQRDKANKILTSLPSSVSEQPRIRRIECNLAHRAGDWQRLLTVTRKEIERVPDSCEHAIAYISALYNAQAYSELDAYLSKNLEFKNSKLSEEFEISKFQIQRGYSDEGLKRLYRLYRNNSRSNEVASYYLGTMLFLSAPRNSIPAIEAGVAVELERDSERWWVAIDFSDMGDAPSWPELVNPESALAQSLIGLTPGNTAAVPRGMGKQTARIIATIPLIKFALIKAQEQIRTSADPKGPIWSINVGNGIEGAGISDFIAKLNSEVSNEQHEMMMHYRSRKMTFESLAVFLDVDPIDLALGWSSKNEMLFTSTGDISERNAENSALISGKRPVFDLLALLEVYRLGIWKEFVRLLGRPFVPATVRATLDHYLQKNSLLEKHSAQQSGATRIGKQLPFAHKLISEILTAIDSDCEIVTAYGSGLSETKLQQISELAGISRDSLYVALEKDAILIAEDAALKIFYQEDINGKATGIQPILRMLRDGRLISQQAYSSSLADKILRNHGFISTNAADMITLAQLTPQKVRDDVLALISTMSHQGLILKTGIDIALQFINHCCKNFPPPVVAAYTHCCLASLTHEREHLYGQIAPRFSELLQSVYGRNGRKLRRDEKLLFHGLLQRT